MTQNNHVLVVDDSPELRDILSLALESHGLTVWSAANADEAESLVSRTLHGFRALITDFHMDPGPSGAELIERLHRKGASIGTYILASSDPYFAQRTKWLLAVGVTAPLHFLPKPYKIDEITRLLDLG